MTTIKEDYVSFETAKLLKEKGFKEITQGYINVDQEIYMLPFQQGVYELSNKQYPYPTFQMAMKWLREVHNIHIELNWDKGNQLYNFSIWKPGKYQPEISSLDLWRIYKDDNYLGEWKYEQACETAIMYCLKHLI